MEVTLVSYTQNPDRVVAQAARVCYSQSTAFECFNRDDEDPGNDFKDWALIRKLKESGHMSPFEHVSFTFSVDGLSRIASHQLVRHRMASYSQKSQRYTNSSNAKLIVPPSVRGNHVAETIFESAEREALNKYNVLLKEGIPKEDARFILPHGMDTSIVFTMNARSLFNFFNLRLCNRAQREIQVLAMNMLFQVSDVAPEIFNNSGPNCVTIGRCQEKEPCKQGPFKDYEELIQLASKAVY